MTVRHAFEPNQGIRLTKGEVSLLLHAAARLRQTAVVTNVDLFNFFKQINKFLANVGAYEEEQIVTGAPMKADQFPDLKNGEFYKISARNVIALLHQRLISVRLNSILSDD